MSEMMQEVVNHLWQSGLFAGLVAILCYAMRNDGARVRYWLWWSASVKLFVPFSALTLLGARLPLGTPASYVPEAWATTAEFIVRPFAAGAAASNLPALLLAIWITGTAAVAARRLAGLRRVRRLLANAVPLRAPVSAAGRTVHIYRTDARIEPGVVGLFRPAVLLPTGIEAHLTARQLDAVLAHELGHIERRDNLTAAVHMLAEAVFWYFPPVWWIGARLIEERERACDERVVGLGHDRQTYAEGVLNVCEHYATVPVACTAGVSGGDLSRRVTHIMRSRTMPELKLVKKILLTLAAAAAIAAPILAGMATTNAALAQQVQRDAAAQDTDEAVQGDGGGDTAEDVQPYLPLESTPPAYPPRAAQRGLEGHVVVEFTVTREGETRNVMIVESSNPMFDSSAIEAVRKFRYRPRTIDGVPVEVPGVRTKIAFELGGDQDD